MTRRRSDPPKVRAISCPDSDWDRVRKRAEAAGMSMSRYVVEKALTVELVTDRDGRSRFPPRLVLTEEDQIAIRDGVARITERMADPDDLTDLGRLRKRVGFLLMATMFAMVRDRRIREMTRILAELFGPEEGGRIAERFLTRARRQGWLD